MALFKFNLHNKNDFKNKVIVITGGAGGLGCALVQQLVACEAKVVVLDLTVDKLQTLTLVDNKNLLAIPLDLTNIKALENAIEQVVSTFGCIDILINNAGITHMSTFENTSTELFTTIMAVNFTASVNITRLCLPYLIANKGQIVAISSVAGFAPLYGRSAYSASKHAMEGFFQSLASEIKHKGVDVLIVCPSFVKSRPELVAKVNQGISSPGALKKSTNGEQLSPEYAAYKIVKAITKKQRILYLGKVSFIAHWLYVLFPKLYMHIMTKNARKEFE